MSNITKLRQRFVSLEMSNITVTSLQSINIIQLSDQDLTKDNLKTKEILLRTEEVKIQKTVQEILYKWKNNKT